MRARDVTRRGALQALGLGAVGAVAASTRATAGTGGNPEGQRDEAHVQFVEANPEAGFNYPYWLATPEEFRSPPVPLLVTMNSARPGQPLTGGGPDKPVTVAEWARSTVESYGQVGAWASEQLGIPQLVPVFPLPDGDPVDRTHKTTQLDHQTLQIEGTSLERVDRQLLRMTEHARRERLADRETHDQLLFFGHSSAGQAAEHMAVLHPGEIMAFAASGVNGAVTLPLTELGEHTLNYQVGVADLEAITGSPFDAEAFDGVEKFYIQGGHDTSDRLPFEVPEVPNSWGDPELYATAKAVYGRDMVEDRLPRCHVAFEAADVSAQFRVYPEMTHDVKPLLELGGQDILEFLRRSIEGEPVEAFGQRLRLPFDRTVQLNTTNPSVGDELQFVVSGEHPPPEGLVTYSWRIDDGRTASGPTAAFTFEDAGNHDVTLGMETAHGQVAHRGMSLIGGGSAFAAYRYDVAPPRAELVVGESILVEITATNVGSSHGDRREELQVDGETVDSTGVVLEPGESKRIAFSHPFDEPGEYDVHVPPAYRQTVSVRAEETPGASTTPQGSSTDTTAPSTSTTASTERGDTGSSGLTPGFGAVSALAGIGTAVSYLLSKGGEDDS